MACARPSTESWLDEKSLPARHLRFRGRLQREPSRGPGAGPGTARPARCRPPASDLHIITTTTNIATTPSLSPARPQPRPWRGCRFPCSFGGRLRRRRAPCPALAASSPWLGVCCLRPPAPLPCPRRARPSAWPPTATTLPAAAPRRRTRAQFVIMAVTLMGRIRGLPHDDDVAVSFHYSTVVSSGAGGGGMRSRASGGRGPAGRRPPAASGSRSSHRTRVLRVLVWIRAPPAPGAGPAPGPGQIRSFGVWRVPVWICARPGPGLEPCEGSPFSLSAGAAADCGADAGCWREGAAPPLCLATGVSPMRILAAVPMAVHAV